MSHINISAKRSGDKLTATEFNEVVDAVNDNDQRITAQAQHINNVNNTLEQQQQRVAQNTQALTTLTREHIPHEFYSQAEYDAKEEAGTINPNALTFIYED
ncbi:MAG: hypothetical protein IJ640_10795 [Prevotella sp.]|nr:hypothetical protein [Prevotella sp.]